jgi:acyl carrier protein
VADTSLEGKVLSVVQGIAGTARTPAGAGPDTPLRDNGFWLDSLAMVEIVMECEATFGIVLDVEGDLTPDALSTVRSLAAVIRAKQGQPGR